MIKQAQDKQTLTQYLLGSLPTAETERLDELSFTDDEFAAALQVAEQDLVDAYVQGDLPGATLAQFKAHYLASPRRREQVEFARALRRVAEKSAAAQAAPGGRRTQDKAPRAHTGARRFSPPGFLFAPRPVLQWGAAFVALALLVAGGWLAFENARLRGQAAETQARRAEAARREQELQQELAGRRAADAGVEQELERARAERAQLEQQLKQQAALASSQEPRRPAPASGVLGLASITLTPQLRDAGQPKTVSLSPQTDSVSVRLELEPNDYSAYRVTLVDPAANQTLWRSGTLRARGHGAPPSLNLRLRARLLRAQNYTLRVMGVPAAGAPAIISDYPFRVMK